MDHLHPMGREKPQTQLMYLIRWLGHSQVTHLDLAVQRYKPSGEKHSFLAPLTTKAENLTSSQIQARLPWLRAENVAGADIYFRPYRHMAWPLVFLDDLSPNMANKVARKYRAAVILTSKGRCHLWLHMSRVLDENQRFEIQRDLVRRLNGEADPGSVSGEHWGRLPGFRNRKPCRNCWVNLLTLSHGPSCHPPDVTGHLASQRQKREDHSPLDQGDIKVNHSNMEWGWVMGSLENGVSPRQVLTSLTQRALPRRGPKDAVRYARHTVHKACQILGIPGP